MVLLSKRVKEPLSVMVKPVGSLCNLQCSYCYYLKTDVSKTGASMMSEALLEIFIKQYIEASPGPNVQFTWHGGEPSLAGIDFYEQVLSLQKRYLPAGWNCWNNLQTNGLVLDDQWVAFLARNQFDIGLSIDGSGKLHDSYRVDHIGKGTHQRVSQNLQRMLKYGIKPDLLCTVNANNVHQPLEVYHSLKSYKTGWLQFIPIVVPMEDGFSQETIIAQDYGSFLIAVFDEWLLNDFGDVYIQFFLEAALVLSGHAATLCWMAPSCGTVLVVEHDGSVYSCDHFVDQEHCLGNINNTHLRNIADSSVQKAFGQIKQDTLPSQCIECQWLNLCQGGCPKDRLLFLNTDEKRLNYLCQGYQYFFRDAAERLKILGAMILSGENDSSIKNFFQNELRRKWRGVGPKDLCPCGSLKNAKDCCWSKRPAIAIHRK